MTQAHPEVADVMVAFARCVRDVQTLARRLGYLAASVEEIVEDARDFHGTVESLVGVPPALGASGRVRAAMTDEDRQLLNQTRDVRDMLVYDFFLDHRLEDADGGADGAALARGMADLEAAGQTVRRALDLAGRLEGALAQDERV